MVVIAVLFEMARWLATVTVALNAPTSLPPVPLTFMQESV
jgi:hypothetical protein